MVYKDRRQIGCVVDAVHSSLSGRPGDWQRFDIEECNLVLSFANSRACLDVSVVLTVGERIPAFPSVFDVSDQGEMRRARALIG